MVEFKVIVHLRMGEIEIARRYFSKKREMIYKKLCATKSHPTAEWLYSELKDECPDLSIGTVYRNIAYFKENGMIVSIGNVDGHERFDAKTTPHTHFVCQKCNSVFDVDCVDTSNKSEYYVINSTLGHKVNYHNTSYYGICVDCAQDSEENEIV